MRRCDNPKCGRKILDSEDTYRDHSMRTFCTDCYRRWKEGRK